MFFLISDKCPGHIKDLKKAINPCLTLTHININLSLYCFIKQARLAKEVLAEIPDQLVSFMRSRGIKPGSGQNASASGAAPAYAPDISGFLKM